MKKLINEINHSGNNNFLLIYDDSISLLNNKKFFDWFYQLENRFKKNNIKVILLNSLLSHRDNHFKSIEELIQDLLSKDKKVILNSSMVINGINASNLLYDLFCEDGDFIFIQSSCIFKETKEVKNNFFKIEKKNNALLKLVSKIIKN